MMDRPIVWTDSLSVGVAEIDADHRLLIDLLHQMEAAAAGPEARAVAGSVLAALIDYTDYHFAREERLQQAIGFAEAAEHKRQHQTLRRQVADHWRHFQDGRFDAAALCAFMGQWLRHHILEHDMRFAPLAVAHAGAGAAAAAIGADFFLEGGGA